MRGFIRQRGTTWTAYWSTTDPATGKRVQHSKGGFALKEPARPPRGDSARECLNGIVGSVQDGSWRKDQALTVKQLLEDHWLPAQESRGLKPATIAQYKQVTAAWIVPNIGATKVAGLRPADVQNLVEKLRTSPTSRKRQGLSQRSLQLTVGVLKAACAYGADPEIGLLGRNPLAGVRRPRVEQRPPTTWTAEQARTFLASQKDDRLAVVWSLLLTRGLRRGEVCGLRWPMVGLDAKRLTVAATRVVVDGKAIDSTPKTAAGRRTVSLDDSLMAVLKAHRARQAAEKLAAGEGYADQGYVICDELGAPYHPDTISTWFEEKVAGTDLPAIRLHDTRHTAASLMLASGVPVKVVSEMLGHSSPTITLSIYAHVMPGMAEEAGAALSASLLG